MLLEKNDFETLKNELKKEVLNLIKANDTLKFEESDNLNELSKEETTDLIGMYAFKANLLLQGDAGSGKTYAANEYCKKVGIEPVRFFGNNACEASDLIGMYLPYSHNDEFYNEEKLVWKDGALAESFRKASNGEKTVLIIDEMLRIPNKELNVLLSSLSPINGKYYLRTGRLLNVDNSGIGVEEVLSCDVENLFVIATTNLGNDYVVDIIDPALKERFMVEDINNNNSFAIDIISDVLKSKNFSEDDIFVLKAFLNVILNVLEKELYEKNYIRKNYSLRLLKYIAELSDNVDEFIGNTKFFSNQLVELNMEDYSSEIFNTQQIELIEEIINVAKENILSKETLASKAKRTRKKSKDTETSKLIAS